MAQKVIHKTGRFGYGTMIHVIHMTDDVQALNGWYEDVLGGVLYMGVDAPTYLPPEKRWASLAMVADLCVETMAPEMPVDTKTPVGRFYDKFGAHWHSIGFAVEDFVGVGKHLQQEGVFLGAPGGGEMTEAMLEEQIYFYPHPKQTGGLMVEICKVEMMGDYRLRDDWSSLSKLWRAHPLGLERLGWVTVGVKDLDAYAGLYERLFEVVPVHEGVDDGGGFRYKLVQFGDVLVQFAQPVESGTPLADHVDRHGDMIYGVTMKVLDLDQAERHLKSKGVSTTRRDPETLDANPADTFGALWSFTTKKVPNDPFD